jgi:1-acyl-sn-glycerol-3-phosphate acyltransferase
MFPDSPLYLSHLLLSALGTRLFVYHQDRIPRQGAVLVVSNHRSFMDAPLLMVAIDRSIRFACHHYMGQVPVLKEVVTRLGCFPLGAPEQRQQGFFQQAIHLLQAQEAVGIFPEGAQPMVQPTDPRQILDFHRGFAHLALRAPLQNLAVLPIAIAASDEAINSAVPLKLLGLFDPTEALFQQEGWHPMVFYRRVNLLVGQPFWITPTHQQSYQGKQAKNVVGELTEHVRGEIKQLLSQGFC